MVIWKGCGFMYVYAVVGYLDYETEDKFKNLWQVLSEKNITHYGFETKGKRPHITIADYHQLDKEKFINLFQHFYNEKQKVTISLNTLGTFIGTGTLFMAPTLSTELLDFHQEHHEIFKEFNKDKNSFYLPGFWVPHCTIASRLDDSNMLEAFNYCQTDLAKWVGQLSEIALIQIKLNEKGVAIKDSVILSKKLN